MRADGAQHLDGEAERQAIAQGDPAERLPVTLRAVGAACQRMSADVDEVCTSRGARKRTLVLLS